MQREHKTKLQDLQQILGLDVDLEKLLMKQSQKELQQFKMQKEALEKMANLQKINADQENKIRALK